MELDFDIVVVANHHRKALILDHLKDIPHQVSYTPDYEFSKSFKPQYDQWVKSFTGHQGAFRCLHGHQDALKLSKKNRVLVIEDDAIPNRSDWINVIIDILPFMTQYDIISLHGRNIDIRECSRLLHLDKSILYGYTNKKFNYVLGSLCYMIDRRVISRIMDYSYVGLPMDLFIANNFSFALVDPSPFLHDRSQGSLIDIGVTS
jgi:hypothetical protein